MTTVGTLKACMHYMAENKIEFDIGSWKMTEKNLIYYTDSVRHMVPIATVLDWYASKGVQ